MEERILKILDKPFDLTDLYGNLNPLEDVKIDHSDLQGEFLRQSELVASYGFLSADAEAEERFIEYQLDRLYAVLDQQRRGEFQAAGERITEKKIENSVITDPQYQEIKLNLIEAKRNKQLFKATCQALNHKLQALINAGADNRKTFNEVRTLES